MIKRKCDDCGKTMSKASVLSWKTEYLGNFSIQLNDEYYFCNCGNELLPLSFLREIEKEEQERIENLLLQSVNYDLKTFKSNLITQKELANLLGKSRQAIQKNGKTKTLIFHFICPGGEILYWRPSVLLFAQKGDGRFNLIKD